MARLRNALLAVSLAAVGLASVLAHRCRKENPTAGTADKSAAPTSVPDLIRIVQEVRGLSFKKPPIPRPVTSEELLQMLRTAAKSQFPPAEAALEIRSAEALGFRWQPPYPFHEAAAGVRMDLSASCYDPESGAFCFDASVDLAQRPDVRRKLTSALAEILVRQHFPSIPHGGRAVGDDRAQAWLSVLAADCESTATRCALRDVLMNFSSADSQPPSSAYVAPPFYREKALFPAGFGMKYLEIKQAAATFGGIDALHRSPPISTREILHAAEPPSALGEASLTFEPPHGLPILTGGALGEFGIFLLGKSQLRHETAAAAAQGWLGDHFWLGEAADGDVLVWKSRWDSADDSREFAAAIYETLCLSFALAKPSEPQEPPRYSAAASGRILTVFSASGSSEVLVITAGSASTATVAEKAAGP